MGSLYIFYFWPIFYAYIYVGDRISPLQILKYDFTLPLKFHHMLSCRSSFCWGKISFHLSWSIKGVGEGERCTIVVIIFLHLCQSLEHICTLKRKALHTLLMSLSAMIPPSKRIPYINFFLHEFNGKCHIFNWIYIIGKNYGLWVWELN